MKNIFKLNYLLYAVLTLFIFTACEEDEVAPEEENEVEVFTDVKPVSKRFPPGFVPEWQPMQRCSIMGKTDSE